MVLINDEEKQLLLDRYLDIEWPGDVSDLRCVRCDRVAIIHYVSNCHHLFCDNCRRVFSDGGRWKCPKCQEYITQLDDQDFDVEIKIHKLKTFCPNKKYGCQFEDELRKIPSHLKKCEDTREAALPIEYTGENRIEAVVKQVIKVNAAIGELKEGMREMKDKVEEKLNQLERKFYEMDSKFNALIEKVDSIDQRSGEMELAYKKSTEELAVIMSQLESKDHRIQHSESILQETMKQISLITDETRTKLASITHKIRKCYDKVKEQESKICEVTTAQRALTEITTGIKTTAEERNEDTKLVKKKNIDEFRSMKTMLGLLDQRIQRNESLLQKTTANAEDTRIKMASVIKQQAYMNTEELNPFRAQTYKWTIKDVKNNNIHESDVFSFTGYEYNIKAGITTGRDWVAISFQFIKGGTINRFLKKDGFTTIKYIVIDQYNVENKKDFIREDYLRFADSLSCPNWTLLCGIPAEILSPPYTKDDCLKITMLFEPQSFNHSYVSNNGILMWTVDNYKTRSEELSPDIWSPSFYTSPKGYRVKTRFRLYKEEANVEVFFLTGEHDDSLGINWPHTTTVILFNHTDPSKDLVKRKQSEHVNLYAIPIGRKSIEQIGFVKDDSLLLKVEIRGGC